MEYKSVIDGIKVLERKDCKFYIIENVSDEFKSILRKSLSEICYGINKIKLGNSKFSFQNTVKEFLLRFQPIEASLNDKQKGYLGELLTHIVLRNDNSVEPLSLYFNLEDRSFKKGFDLVFRNKTSKNVILVEVKSGSKREGQIDTTETAKTLLSVAKNDFLNRLNNPADRDRLWNNALSHLELAISNSNTEKMALQMLLNHQWECLSSKQDLFLVAGVLEPLDEPICIDTVCSYHDTIRKNEKLNLLSDNISIIIIHNNIFLDLYTFFLEVEKNG